MIFTEKQIARFWSHVLKTDYCWNWTAKTTRDGYGSVKIGGILYSAHRIAYEICTGDNPKGYEILHSCDNPVCCNPAHLRKGTHKENMQDMILRGRQGKAFPNKIKITQEIADKIRADYLIIQNKLELSRIYDLSAKHIRDIIARKYWKGV